MITDFFSVSGKSCGNSGAHSGYCVFPHFGSARGPPRMSYRIWALVLSSKKANHKIQWFHQISFPSPLREGDLGRVGGGEEYTGSALLAPVWPAECTTCFGDQCSSWNKHWLENQKVWTPMVLFWATDINFLGFIVLIYEVGELD